MILNVARTNKEWADDIVKNLMIMNEGMEVALAQAKTALNEDEVPVGCAIRDPQGRIIAKSANRMRAWRDPTAHAEMIALRKAVAQIGPYLYGCSLFVTLEPCRMCAAAASLARISRVIYGASNPNSGGAGQALNSSDLNACNDIPSAKCNHNLEIISGIGAEESSKLLMAFFNEKR